MEITIINKKEYPLLSRVKVESEIKFDKATPSRDEIKSKLGKELGKEKKLIVVKGIYMEYGLKKAKNMAYIYENEEALKRIEVEKKEKSGKKKEAKPTVQEKPVKKEEKPKEAKPGEKKEKMSEQDKPETKGKKQ